MPTKWDKDKRDGEFAEEKFISLITETLGDVIVDVLPYKRKERDLTILFSNGKTLTAEVKYDRSAHITGNTVIEYESRGIPSGISTTEADIWIQYFEGEFWIIPVRRLKNLLEGTKKIYFRKVMGGDLDENGTPTSKLYLITTNSFKRYASKFDEVAVLLRESFKVGSP